MSSCFVTFEGIDGCGKSTQLALLAEGLRRLGRRVVETFEPGATSVGVSVRRLLLTPDVSEGMSPLAELFLFAADRAQHMSEVVVPGLDGGAIVLSDRHSDSSIAYQAAGGGLDPQLVGLVSGIATGGKRPDRTFLLDVDPVVAAQRRSCRADDRIEAAGLEFMRRAREGFLRLADEHPERIRVVDGTKPAGEIAGLVLADVLELVAHHS